TIHAGTIGGTSNTSRDRGRMTRHPKGRKTGKSYRCEKNRAKDGNARIYSHRYKRFQSALQLFEFPLALKLRAYSFRTQTVPRELSAAGAAGSLEFREVPSAYQ